MALIGLLRWWQSIWDLWEQAKMDRLSDHFCEYEFACPHCGKAPMDPVLINSLELLRTLLTKRYGQEVWIGINSGYRCKEYNEDLIRRGYNASRTSQHLTGRAADCRFPPWVNLAVAHDEALQIGPFEQGGIGVYAPYRVGEKVKGNFLHLDTRGSIARFGEVEGKRVRYKRALKEARKWTGKNS